MHRYEDIVNYKSQLHIKLGTEILQKDKSKVQAVIVKFSRRIFCKGGRSREGSGGENEIFSL